MDALLNEYYTWKVANHLISNRQFELIQADRNNKEIWLKGIVNKKTTIIRLYSKGFDWSNHLKRDIAFVIERVRKIQKMLKGKEIQIYNLYFAQYQPVDDWSSLKKNILLKDRKSILTKTFYLYEENRNSDVTALFNELEMEPPLLQDFQNEEELERELAYFKQEIIGRHQQQKREVTSIFNYGKPFFTYILMAINILIYFWMESKGDTTNMLHLIEWGAKFNPYIMDGEWWRIVTSMFLHIGTLHIMMNMFALYYLGVLVEKMYGNVKFLFIYFLSGIAGGLTSFAFNQTVAAGASGAIFGMFGALLFFGIQNRKIFLQTMGGNLLFVILLNIVLGFSIPNIDMGAHLGGLLGGFIASSIVQMPKKKAISTRIIGTLVYLFLIAGLVAYGIERNTEHLDPEAQHLLAFIHLENDQYNEAVTALTNAINNSEQKKEQYYFDRSVAFYFLKQWENARDDLIEVVTLNNRNADAHYNLALIYMELSEFEKAREHAQKAAELIPNNQQFQNLVNHPSLNR